jgi:murein DD-endopeptidase MepM/ murein hydrolase activator NlpD
VIPGLAAILLALSQLLIGSLPPPAAPAPARPASDLFELPLTAWKPHCDHFGSPWTYCDGTPLRSCANGAVWRHTGADEIAAVGTPVRAAGDGVIIGYLVDPQFRGGVLIRHRTTFGVYITQYWHVWLRSGFRVGTAVKRGQVFANVASMGSRTHFHFAVYHGDFGSHAWNGALPPSPGCSGFPAFPYRFVDPTAFVEAHSAS